MRSLHRLLLSLLLALTTSSALAQNPISTEPHMTTVAQSDATQIRAAMDGMQAAWNHHDMRAFVSFMTEDVEWVNVVGMWWKGKEQVFRAHDAMHRSMFKDRSLHDPETVALRTIAPGVVLATIIMTADGYTTPDGQAQPPSRNVLTEIFVHRDGHWLVAEGHNTTIVEAAQAHDPGK